MVTLVFPEFSYDFLTKGNFGKIMQILPVFFRDFDHTPGGQAYHASSL
jgi:hypothetical protein